MKENLETAQDIPKHFETYTISCNTHRGLNTSPMKENAYIPNFQRVQQRYEELVEASMTD